MLVTIETGKKNSDETTSVACENTITQLLRLKQEMEEGYWGSNSGIKETDKEEKSL